MEQKLLMVCFRLVSSKLTHFSFTFICQETLKLAVNITTQHSSICDMSAVLWLLYTELSSQEVSCWMQKQPN